MCCLKAQPSLFFLSVHFLKIQSYFGHVGRTQTERDTQIASVWCSGALMAPEEVVR